MLNNISCDPLLTIIVDNPLLASIVGSIIGAIIISVLWNIIKLLWGNLLLNKLPRNKPLLANFWTTKFDDGGKEKEEVVELNQKGRQILGKIYFKNSDQKIIDYKFNGTFKDRILTATYEFTDVSEFERGTFTLNYLSGNLFKGKYIFFSTESNEITSEISSSDYTWFRSNYNKVKDVKKLVKRKGLLTFIKNYFSR